MDGGGLRAQARGRGSLIPPGGRDGGLAPVVDPLQAASTLLGRWRPVRPSRLSDFLARLAAIVRERFEEGVVAPVHSRDVLRRDGERRRRGPAPSDERVVQAAALAQAGDVARLRLVLTPPELGRLQLDVALRRRSLEVALRAERAATAEAIRAELPVLRAALERQGFALAELRVSAGEGPAAEPSGAPPGRGGGLDLEA